MYWYDWDSFYISLLLRYVMAKSWAARPFGAKGEGRQAPCKAGVQTARSDSKDDLNFQIQN